MYILYYIYILYIYIYIPSLDMHFSRLWYPSQSLLVLIDSLNTDMEDRGCIFSLSYRIIFIIYILRCKTYL